MIGLDRLRYLCWRAIGQSCTPAVPARESRPDCSDSKARQHAIFRSQT
jgi:hypothetical protein